MADFAGFNCLKCEGLFIISFFWHKKDMIAAIDCCDCGHGNCGSLRDLLNKDKSITCKRCARELLTLLVIDEDQALVFPCSECGSKIDLSPEYLFSILVDDREQALIRLGDQMH